MKQSRAIKSLSIKALLLFCIALCSIGIAAQDVPGGINYQAALRDAKGAPIADSTFSLSVLLHKNATDGEIVYEESHDVTSSNVGLFSVIIGTGNSSSNISDVAWDKGPFFMELRMNDQTFSITQLLSVPYAMHAASASRLSNLSDPISSDDPTTKQYVDSTLNSATEELASKAFVKAELEGLDEVEFASDGDTLFANGVPIIIPGLNANNNTPLSSQVCLGGSNQEAIKTFIKTEKGTYLMGAESFSRNGDLKTNKGQSDIWIAELDSSFNILWQKSIGGSSYDHITHLFPLSNGEILIGGTTESNTGDITGNHGAYDIFLAFLDIEHNVRWSKCYGGSNADFLNDIVLMEDGSILLGGTTFSKDKDIDVNNGDADIWLIKLDPHQEIEWKNTYGGLRYESLEKIISKDDEFFIFGETESNSGMVKANNGAMDLWVALIGNNGALIKQQCVGSSNNEELHVVTVQDDNFILGGISFAINWDPASSVTQKNLWISLLDSDLKVVTSKTYGGSSAERISGIHMDQNKDLIIVGSSSSYDGDVAGNFGDDDFLLFKTDANIELSSQHHFGGSYSDRAEIIKKTSQGYILAGISYSEDEDVKDNNGESDIWLLRTDADFNPTASWHFGGSQVEELFDVIVNEDNSFVLIGTTQSDDFGIKGFHGKAGKNRDILILKDSFK